MKTVVNQSHPRIYVDGEPQLIPLCLDFNSTDETSVLDQFGIAVSFYFKILKTFVWFFIICTILCSPLFYIYSGGKMSQQANGPL
jgi:hypothetical protein